MTTTKKKPSPTPVVWTGPSQLRKHLVAIEQLLPDPKNPRRHGARNLETIRSSIEAFGQVKPLLVRQQGSTVVCGNGTLQVLKDLGWTHAAATIVALTDAQARALAIADNRSGELAEWDFAELSDALGDEKLEDFTAAMGFSAGELDDLLEEADAAGDDEATAARDRKVSFTAKDKPAEEGADPADDDFEPPAEPTAKLGDVWECGAHEVLCGDCFSDEAAKWIGRGRFDAVVTDPPYAIYGSSTGVGRSVADDRMVRPFFDKVAALIRTALKTHAHAYVSIDWRSWAAFWDAARSAELAIANQLVWDKGSGLGSNYQNAFELIAFCHRLPSARTMSKGREKGVRTVLKPNVLRFPRPAGDEREHNAAKPVKLLQQLLENSTDVGDLVLDPFGGSGSTLIAAERTGRKCRSIEVEPKWVDVIVARWERTTGQKATRKKP